MEEKGSPDPEYDTDTQREIARSSFADMLHDTERNDKYNNALKSAIDKMHSSGRRAKVLDIGTGSGLLSMMAVKCGADSVIACEAFAPIGRSAENVLKVNEFYADIKLVIKHSTKLTVGKDGDLPERANILVAEVFDTELIGEGALQTFRHACKMLLEPDSIVIPSFGIMYAQVVECQTAQNWNHCNDFYDSDGELLIKVPEIIKQCSGTGAVHDIQLSQLPAHSFKQISSPQPIFKFDWSGKLPLLSKEVTTSKVVAECDGTAQVVFIWWELAMDPESKVILSCAPYWAHPLKEANPNLTSSDIPWRDHWLQAIYYFPKEVPVTAGQELNLISTHDEYSLWFYLEPELNLEQEFNRPVCDCGFHIAHSRSRMGIINDESRRKKYLSTLKKYVNSESVVLFLGHGFYLGLAAQKLKAKKIFYLLEESLDESLMRDFIATNGIINVQIFKTFDVLREHINSKDITLIFGEPFFMDSILPWDNLQFSHMIRNMSSYLSKDVTIVPHECLIKALLVEFENLQKINNPVEVWGDFDMKPFDEAIKMAVRCCDAAVDAHALWEYPARVKSQVTSICRLNMTELKSSPFLYVGNCIPTFLKDRHFNAVAFWSEYHLDETSENVIYNGPIRPIATGEHIQWDMNSKQGVLFVQPKSVGSHYINFEYKLESRTVHVSFC